jgi:signal transduction histidine kinase/DNA-binding response OmpR family regulator/streptogramin lyase
LKRKCIFKYSQKFNLNISRFHYDVKAKKLWIGTFSDGLFCYDLNRNSMSRAQTSVIPKQPILAIETNSDSDILVGIDGQGIWRLNNTATQVLEVYKEDVNDPSSLRGNGVYDIFNDQNKRIWVCTYSGGISFFDLSTPMVGQLTHTINNPNSLVNNNVNKILQDKRGNIWFATDNGLCFKESGTGNWKTFYQNTHSQAAVFSTLCEDDQGRIWAGTYSSGLYILDEQTGREIAHYSTETSGFSLENNFVSDIFKDSQGDLWLGSVQGKMTCYLSKENKFRSYSSQSIYTFNELSTNNILLACTYGLRLLDKRSGAVKAIQDGYLVQDVITIKDEIWICTSGEGLIRYNQRTHDIKKITTASGLPSNYINSIMYEGGYLWLGTESGLCRLEPKSMGILTYNSIYPLSRVSFNRGSKCRLSDGQLIFGTSNGAVLFSPKSLKEVQLKGVIFFQNLTLAGRSFRGSLSSPLDSLQKLSLNYNQNTLQLELLTIGNVLGAKFSWKLKGLDNYWSQPSENRFVQYSNMPSGNYLLKIRLYDNSLSHIISERTLAVSIIPPFWKSWWFELLFFVFIVAIFYMSLRYYIERLNQKHAEDKVRVFTNTAHDIRTSLTLIRAPIEELKKEMNLSDIGTYYLSLATEQARRLSTAVTQLMDFQKVDLKKEQLALVMVDIVELIEHRRLMFESFAKNQNVILHFTSNQESYQTAVDELMIVKVVDNLISNAIKYSRPDSQVQLDLKCKPDNWTFEIKDNGIGISTKAQNQLFSEFYRGENAINSKIVGSGIGLLLVKNYVELHDGDISYVSQENVGSTFKVVVPFKAVIAEETAEPVEFKESFPSVLKEIDLQSLQHQEKLSKQVMSILVVEDNDDLRNFMQYPLQEDFDVLLAKDGVEAWEIVQKQMPDLVISDVMMPKMDGFELCKLLKSTYETSHIPVILLTSLSGKAEQLHGLGLGADDYLTKPFDMTLLVQRIKSIIRNRKAVKEKALKLIKGSGDRNEHILTNVHNDEFVKKMLEIVKINMANTEFGKDDFASAMNVSTSLLYKKVKSLTDQSPTDFIKMVRLDYALELLQNHNYSVTEVSEHCGFSSIGYFSTVFKKHFGKTPNEI